MHVANRELCQELYELSGWVGTEKQWSHWHNGVLEHGKRAENFIGEYRPVSVPPHHDDSNVPAYDLGYLLRKLPERRNDMPLRLRAPYCLDNSGWSVESDTVKVEADTPEDATAMLAIELFKQGVLKREAS